MDKYHIPAHLDAPFKIVIWTVDEILLFLIPFLIFLSGFNAPITGLTIGTGGVLALKKLKGEEGHCFLQLLYWYFPPMIRYQSISPSYKREILG